MSLDSIVERIQIEGLAQKEKIIQAAQKEAEELIYRARLEAERLNREIIETEKAIAERQKQSLIVNARLKARNALLSAKQELIGAVFEKVKISVGKGKFKKYLIFHEKISEAAQDPADYFENIRHEFETEIAGILFD